MYSRSRLLFMKSVHHDRLQIAKRTYRRMTSNGVTAGYGVWTLMDLTFRGASLYSDDGGMPPPHLNVVMIITITFKVQYLKKFSESPPCRDHFRLN